MQRDGSFSGKGKGREIRIDANTYVCIGNTKKYGEWTLNSLSFGVWNMHRQACVLLEGK